MKKKECPSCAMAVDEATRTCPICGYEFPTTSIPTRLIAIILILLSVYFLLSWILR